MADKIRTGPRPEAPCATFTVLKTVQTKSTERALKVGLAVGNPLCVSSVQVRLPLP